MCEYFTEMVFIACLNMHAAQPALQGMGTSSSYLGLIWVELAELQCSVFRLWRFFFFFKQNATVYHMGQIFLNLKIAGNCRAEVSRPLWIVLAVQVLHLKVKTSVKKIIVQHVQSAFLQLC